MNLGGEEMASGDALAAGQIQITAEVTIDFEVE